MNWDQYENTVFLASSLANMEIIGDEMMMNISVKKNSLLNRVDLSLLFLKYKSVKEPMFE